MSTLDTLLDSIFDGQRPAFYTEFADWIRESRRFRTFATDYRTKIRAKLKHAGDDNSLLDLRAELATAALLLGEPRFTLEYEAYAAAKQRGPDFTVTFKTHTPFNVEVRRLRPVELDEDDDPDAQASKLIAVLCDKVGQMPPSTINLLWLMAENGPFAADLDHAARTLVQLAEHKDEGFFTRRGFASAADFLKQYGRLSGIVLHQAGAQTVWLNALARHKVPSPIVTALLRLTLP